jgi:outer membrane protein assembly factor BamB
MARIRIIGTGSFRGSVRGQLIAACVALVALAGAGSMGSGGTAGGPSADWPSFRGPNAGGVADGAATPTTWNAEKGDNILWKTPVPGLGHSSPIIWGDKVFVTTSISGKEKPELKVGLYGDIAPVNDDTVHQWKVICLNKKTGKTIWEQTAVTGVPKVKRHTKATHANSTMAADGKHVVAFFGSEGLYCYDLNGKPLWKKDLGVLDSGYYVVPTAQCEFAASPVLDKGIVFVQCDIQKGSFLAAFDADTGVEKWRTPRDDVPTWSTPTIYHDGNRAQILVNGYNHMGAYDAPTGKELWRLSGGGDIPIPTPIVSNGLIYFQSAHGPKAPIYAVKTTATGDVSLKDDETSSLHVAWATRRGGGYMQTPIIIGDYFYSCQINGVLTCYEAKTGKQVYQERLGTGRTGFTASPVAANGLIYIASEDGDVYVVKAGPEFRIVATNPMGEICMATPAISDGIIYVRTQGNLVAISDKAKRASR